MPNTTNFNFPTPADTDLVKDGASAIRSLGNSIDTAFVDLKGGTTGQVLAKATNTDLDFTWVAQDDSNAIQNAIVDAKGDLITATAADTPARLAVGTNGQVLAANSSTATGLEWQTISSGGMTSIASGTLSGASVSITSIPTTYNELWLYINGFDPATDDVSCNLTFNGVTSGSKYYQWFSGNATITDGGNADLVSVIRATDNTVTTGSVTLRFPNYKSTNSVKIAHYFGTSVDKTTTTTVLGTSGFLTFNEPTSAISSVNIFASSGNMDGGTYALYGVK